jgi:hypothetical protein
MSSNTAPLVDDLGDIRAEIARLEARHDALRGQVTALGEGLHIGSRWTADVKVQKRERVDIPALRKTMPQVAQKFMRTTVSPFIYVRSR